MNYKELLQEIKCFVFDIDGVMTTGDVFVTETGRLLRTMYVRDGYAIRNAIKKGFLIGVISAGTDKSVIERLTQVGISRENIFLGATDKVESLHEFCDGNSIQPDKIAYMGDDIPDIGAMQLCRVISCPQDASPEVKAVANYVSHKNGGKGCVRDIIEQTLKIQRKWEIP